MTSNGSARTSSKGKERQANQEPDESNIPPAFNVLPPVSAPGSYFPQSQSTSSLSPYLTSDRRTKSHATSSVIADDASSETSSSTSTGPSNLGQRPRSSSMYVHSATSFPRRIQAALPLALDYLDFSGLRALLLGHVNQAEETLKTVREEFSGSENEWSHESDGEGESDETDNETNGHSDPIRANVIIDPTEGAVQPSTLRRRRRRREERANSTASAPPSSSSLHTNMPAPRSLDALMDQLSAYLASMKSELLSATSIPATPGSITLAGPAARAKLEELVTSLEALGASASASRATMVTSLTAHLERLRDAVDVRNRAEWQWPSVPLTPGQSRVPSISTVQAYFRAESDRLARAISKLPDIDTIHIPHNPLSDALKTAKTARHYLHDYDRAEDELYARALELGKTRLLVYDELPQEWRNNAFIISGYRFIPMERWRALFASFFGWHNETLNIHTHVVGSVFVAYLLANFSSLAPIETDLPYSPMDRFVNALFLVAAIKCLVLSAIWHLFAGCASRRVFIGTACLDYIGISALIAASVISLTWYGLRCNEEIAMPYIYFIGAVGLLGMYLPWKEWFNKRENKGWRIAFFLSMCASAVAPQAHMAWMYGLVETITFFIPALWSVAAYVAGLVLYAQNWPESIGKKGAFDCVGHSHQFWHLAICLAIWLHWRALGILHTEGSIAFSCATQPMPALIAHAASVIKSDSVHFFKQIVLAFSKG
ncbi:uncharacterized protein L969DRAFT_95931 [Mixia osmundae IAM 14324]|uniref:Uncharacterized protein n=1 Tax=Mixia osmundae (strain CBS 9802 / IAM 14324 / JCM 22182 / KY 12970) TaxID=764103 RepID=G7DX01_MIXOS|nr:uncharacterized protein L969DRAFT_95931 [Mixia osmundae IAM 14324]KEI38093.1 hypothetical protein L969DRAFT_95931 [Mixia osmundae IAM 14324]GAA95098.1 hypothetical protein E5Q_01753 [Mixia osmundae IAM 14324]